MLDNLGITRWRLRSSGESVPVSGPAPNNVSASLSKPVPKFVCVAQLAHADTDLLNNILKALHCASDEAEILWVNDPDTLKNHLWPEAPVIVFGETLHPYVPKHAIKTLDLTALTSNISAKKTLWSQLKTLI